MKESWEIKKLGDCCNIQTGKLDANAKVENGKYPFYTCDSQPYRIDTYAFDAEAILISGNGSLVGHVNYYKGKFNAYQRTYVLTEFSSFYIPYLIHFLKKYIRPYIMKNKKGGCIPYITLPILKNFLIPCPPLPEQEHIVAELDCLSGAIEKQKQQLKELDNLAQAIFYDMFGDPITNEKGWEIKKLSDACPYITDGSHYSPKEDEKGTIPMLSVKDMRQSDFSYDSCKMIGTEEYLKLLSNGCKPLKDDVLVAKDGSYFKYIFALKEEREQALLSSIAIVRPNKSMLNSVYLVGYLSTAEIYNEVEREYLTGTAIKRVILKGLRSMRLLLPPLSLQQEFASKIEAIEKQKELIKQSLSETETLFNSRMDYYFN